MEITMPEALRTAGFAFASSRDRLQRLGRRIDALAGGCEGRVQALLQSLERLPQAATFEPFAAVVGRAGSAPGAGEAGEAQVGQRVRAPRAAAARGNSATRAAQATSIRTQGPSLPPHLSPNLPLRGGSPFAQGPGWPGAVDQGPGTAVLPAAQALMRGQGSTELGQSGVAVPAPPRRAIGAGPSGGDAAATPMPWLPRSAPVDVPAMARPVHSAASPSVMRAAFASWAAQHPAEHSLLPAQQVLQQQLAALEAVPSQPAMGAAVAAWPMPPHARRGAAAGHATATVPASVSPLPAAPAVLTAAAAARPSALEPVAPRAVSRLLPAAPSSVTGATAHDSAAAALPAQAPPDEDTLLDAMNHRLIDQAWLRGVDLR
jgi:hypothetical protein